MIRDTLPHTQEATFCVEFPSARQHGMPTPAGTGFFVSPDGWFVTAAHVVTQNNASDGLVRDDIGEAWLMKEIRQAGGPPGAMCQGVSIGHVIPHLDFALLRVDFAENATKTFLTGKSEFPFVSVSRRDLDEGESVYSFGYPLSSAVAQDLNSMIVGTELLCPRVTSAIVSSTLEQTGAVMTSGDPRIYVLDKALNYGNSGGPIVSTETGRVHAFCSRFQPVFVPQPHLRDANGAAMAIMIPSLYGVVSSLGNVEVLSLLEQLGVPLVDD